MIMEVKGIARRAMLVSLNIGHWGSSKTDQEATRVIHKSKNASADAGRYVKNLIDPAALKGVRAAQTALRNFHVTNTMPWTDNGWRLLPTANFIEYSSGISDLEREVNHEVHVFITQHYDEQVIKAQQRLGDMFHAAEYPDKSDLAHRYYSHLSRRPVPLGQDLRLDITAEQEEAIREQINIDAHNAIADAMKEPYRRIAETLANTIESISHYGEVEPGAKKMRTFRDSAITNIKEMCQLLPRFNLTDDPELQSLINNLTDRIDGVEPEDLRSNDAMRQQKMAELEEIRAIAAYSLS